MSFFHHFVSQYRGIATNGWYFPRFFVAIYSIATYNEVDVLQALRIATNGE